MNSRLILWYFYSVGALLFVTAAAKFASAGGNARILEDSDPILQLSFRHVFLLAGAIETVVAAICLFARWPLLQAALTAWLATNFAAYRIGLLWIGYQKPCHCLGNLTDAIHITPSAADHFMKGMLVYFMVGGYGILFRLWREKRQLPLSSLPPEAPPSGTQTIPELSIFRR